MVGYNIYTNTMIFIEWKKLFLSTLTFNEKGCDLANSIQFLALYVSIKST